MAPYYVLKDAGAEIVLTSPKGDQPPFDPKSDNDDVQTDARRRFKDDDRAPKGLAKDAGNIRLIKSFAKSDRTIGAIYHALEIF